MIGKTKPLKRGGTEEAEEQKSILPQIAQMSADKNVPIFAQRRKMGRDSLIWFGGRPILFLAGVRTF